MLTRRTAIASVAAAAAVTRVAGAQQDGTRQRPIVLVHGAGHGGWCWKFVRERLRAQGFPVFTPTLTGMGERVHLRSPALTLETHILDVAHVIRWEELNDVVLVGHSYAGTVITGVCDRLKDRIGHMVYLDASTPQDGQSTIPGITKALTEERVGPLEEGYLVPMDLVALGVDAESDAIKAWMKRRLTGHPYQLWAEPIKLVNGGSEGVDRTFVLCADPAKLPPPIQEKFAALRTDPTWRYVEKTGPHDIMITDPEFTAGLIGEIARSS